MTSTSWIARRNTSNGTGSISRAAKTRTRGLPHAAQRVKKTKKKPEPGPIVSDHTPAEYAANVETVREGMRLGDYYEVVLRQTFRTPYAGGAAELFERIQKASPSPYEFLLQFGDEQLIGASPEMFVRVEQREDGARVETCPIAGTARRTGDPLRDADNIRELLSRPKKNPSSPCARMSTATINRASASPAPCA